MYAIAQNALYFGELDFNQSLLCNRQRLKRIVSRVVWSIFEEDGSDHVIILFLRLLTFIYSSGKEPVIRYLKVAV